MSQKIKFLFDPDGFDTGAHAVEKSDDQGRKRRYLAGISSGLQVDAHGERMTENAIKSFMRQANDHHLLLHADQHGVRSSEDIGILTKTEVLRNGDWYTEFRLHEAYDGTPELPMDKASIDRGNKIWMQVNGLGPYEGKPLEKGFSIEGSAEDDDIIMDSAGRNMLNDVQLDAVVVVPRPAYKPSVVQAVSKALGMAPPISLRGHIQELMRRDQESETMYRKRYQIDDALERVVSQIVAGNEDNPNEMRDQLAVVFNEYGEIMIDLIVASAGAIIGEGASEEVARDAASERLNLSKAIVTSLADLQAIQIGGAA